MYVLNLESTKYRPITRFFKSLQQKEVLRPEIGINFLIFLENVDLYFFIYKRSMFKHKKHNFLIKGSFLTIWIEYDNNLLSSILCTYIKRQILRPDKLSDCVVAYLSASKRKRHFGLSSMTNLRNGRLLSLVPQIDR